MIPSKKTTLMILLSIAIVFAFRNSTAFANLPNDSAITSEVQARLADEKDMPKGLEVITQDGVVSIKGEVETSLQAHRAIEVASSVEGVVDVVDAELKVKESKALLTDTIITAKIKGKIRQLYIRKQIAAGYDLHVETTDQVAHISGTVARAADLDTVVSAAKKVKNVKSVKTSITY